MVIALIKVAIHDVVTSIWDCSVEVLHKLGIRWVSQQVISVSTFHLQLALFLNLLARDKFGHLIFKHGVDLVILSQIIFLFLRPVLVIFCNSVLVKIKVLINANTAG